MPLRSKPAFTLAELLIALAILGVIATFTIPKVLVAQQDQKYNAIAKEAAGAVSAAFATYRAQNPVTANTEIHDIIPYLNYVKQESSGYLFDERQTQSGTIDCTSYRLCLFLHNGALLMIKDISFDGTASTNAIEFYVDPDGRVTDGNANGSGRTIHFFLYANSRLTTRGTTLPNTVVNATNYVSPAPAFDPPWFSWD